jgi:hypothetical protein
VLRSTIAAGDQLVDRRVDRRVLASDAHASEEAADEEVPGGERERGRHGRDQVQQQRHHKQPLASVSIGELSKHEGADARPRDVDRGRRTDVGCIHVDAAAALGQSRRDRADDRHLEPVKDPHGSEPDHDSPVEARPGQSVQAGRDPRADRPQTGGGWSSGGDGGGHELSS